MPRSVADGPILRPPMSARSGVGKNSRSSLNYDGRQTPAPPRGYFRAIRSRRAASREEHVMRRIFHPISGAVYEELGDGLVSRSQGSRPVGPVREVYRSLVLEVAFVSIHPQQASQVGTGDAVSAHQPLSRRPPTKPTVSTLCAASRINTAPSHLLRRARHRRITDLLRGFPDHRPVVAERLHARFQLGKEIGGWPLFAGENP